MSDWHSKEIEDVLREVGGSRAGLDEAEAAKRLAQFGRNEIQAQKGISPLRILAKQFAELLIIILLIAVLISLLLGEVADALIILVIVIASSLLGFFQEYRAERVVEALKKLGAAYATVLRGSHEIKIPSVDVVQGDMLLVRAGDKISADARIIEAFNLRVDESILTGESNPVSKQQSVLPRERILAERKNMLFSGTIITYGRAKGVVVATGMGTEFGSIAGLLQSVEEGKTPLEERISLLGKWIGLTSLLVVGVVFFLGLVRGNDLIEMFLFGVSLAVAAVPEALPAIVTGSLAIAVQAMAKKKAIVRRLPAVETLGSTTIICSDKTGTLTKGEMTVKKVYDGDRMYEVSGVGYDPKGEISGYNPTRSNLLQIAVLCNDANLVKEPDGSWGIDGDPTEGCLIVLGMKAGLEKRVLQERYPRVGEVPFSSERKMMTTVHNVDGKRMVYVKGAPEIILKRCVEIARETNENLGEKERDEIRRVNEGISSLGLRVLAMAYRRVSDDLDKIDEAIENELTFAGLVGMIDPPREEVGRAVAICRDAGIKTVMITGDQILTATSVARELGIYRDGKVMSGEELEKIDDAKFDEMVENVEVYARVSPEHKIKIVRALKKKGHIVAMTGDGVNDAPALKGADIGVAMGITGTEVSKEAADMILLDDNFATLVTAVERGRATYDNIKKYLLFLLSANGGEILIMLLASLIGLPLPLLPVQILYINLATDGFPAIALGVDPPTKEIMKRRPRDPDESIFRSIRTWTIGISTTLGVISLLVFSFSLASVGLDKARTILFLSIVIFELSFAFSARSQTFTLIKLGALSNRYLILAVIWEISLLGIIFFVPALSELFHLVPLSAYEWMIAAGVGALGFILPEISKVIVGALRKS